MQLYEVTELLREFTREALMREIDDLGLTELSESHRELSREGRWVSTMIAGSLLVPVPRRGEFVGRST